VLADSASYATPRVVSARQGLSHNRTRLGHVQRDGATVPALAASLNGSVRVHLYGCAMLLAVVRRRARRLGRRPSVS
jgi:hypothetical protein